MTAPKRVFELLARRVLTGFPEFFRLHSFRVIDERRWNAKMN